MAIARVQTQTANAASTNAIAATFGSTTVSGNLLIAFVCYSNISTLTITPPSGWTAQSTNSNASANIATFYYKNAPATSSSQSWGFSGSFSTATLAMLEYSGADTSSPFDASGGAQSNFTTTHSFSATSTVAHDLFCGGVTAGNGTTWSAPTASYSIAVQNSTGSNCGVGVIENLDVAAIGASSPSITSGNTCSSASILMCFKLATSTATLFRAANLANGSGGQTFVNPLG